MILDSEEQRAVLLALLGSDDTKAPASLKRILVAVEDAVLTAAVAAPDAPPAE